MAVLIVDDDEKDRKIVAEHFSRNQSHLVIECGSVVQFETTLAILKTKSSDSPALILLDLQIEGDANAGWKMLQLAKASLPHVPVVIVSSDNRKRTKQKSYAGGACTHVSKGIDSSAYRAKMAQLEEYWQDVAEIL
ncbi:MAG: response regulator [Pseudomonadota bacterium]